MKKIDVTTRRAKIYKKSLVLCVAIGCVMVLISGKKFVEENIPKDVFSQNQVDSEAKPKQIKAENANAQIQGKNTKIYASGMPVGLYLHTDGVMIIDCATFENIEGKRVSPLKGKVQKGDYIEKINGESINSKSELVSRIKENQGKKIKLEIKRNQEQYRLSVKPEQDKSGEYKIGIWVRDDMQGLGTITFVTDDGTFGALGHGISDLDTGTMVSSISGQLYKANIWGIKKGEKGEPGGFCGSIDYKAENHIGDIVENTNAGLFGTLDKEQMKQWKLREIEIADENEVRCGKASILLYMDGKYQEYEIQIKKVKKNSSQNKNLVIKITDPKLLSKTNGIIQGMSGTPIIQDGKLVGAVTHVFVSDASMGYGILIKNMIE